MSLLYVDGFEEQDVLGWLYYKGDPVDVSYPAGRIAGNALRTNGSGNYGHSQWLTHPFVSTSTSYYIGFGFRAYGTGITWNVGNDTSGPGHGVVLYGSGAARLHIGPNASGQLEVRNGSGSTGTLLGTGTTVLLVNTWYYIEVYALINGSTGAVTVRLNGANEIVLTNVNTQNGSGTALDTILLGGSMNMNGTAYFDYDDLYVCDGAGTVNNTFLGDCQVQTLFPNGNGATNGWVNDAANSTNNYSHVNSVPYSTATYVGSSTLNQVDEYAYTDPTGSGTVKGVMARAIATKTDSGGRSLALVARPTTTDYAGSGTPLTAGSWALAYNIWETNPDTSTAWTIATVTAAQFGVKVSA